MTWPERHIDLSHVIFDGMTTYPGLPAHSILLADGIPIIEHLTNLASLPPSGFRFSAVPPKITGAGTFTVRAYASIPASTNPNLVETLR